MEYLDLTEIKIQHVKTLIQALHDSTRVKYSSSQQLFIRRLHIRYHIPTGAGHSGKHVFNPHINMYSSLAFTPTSVSFLTY